MAILRFFYAGLLTVFMLIVLSSCADFLKKDQESEQVSQTEESITTVVRAVYPFEKKTSAGSALFVPPSGEEVLTVPGVLQFRQSVATTNSTE